MNTRGQGLDETTPSRIPGKNYLFAIAIDQYQYSPPLYNCVQDIEHIISLLHRDYQFEAGNTYTLFNESATEKNIFDTFKKLVKTIKSEDNLLILYSGHGEFEADIEEGYWIPVDAQLGDFSDYVSNSRIVKYLKAINAHHILLIVDSCFSGTLFAHRNAGSSHSALRLDEIPSRWLITAGRNEVVSDGKPGDHSPFADNIIYFLENNKENSLSVADLSDAVTDAVIYNSRQTPRGEPLQDVGHRGGQFFFHRKGFVPAPTPTSIENSPEHDTEPLKGPIEAKIVEPEKVSGISGFWLWSGILIGIFAIALLAGSLFRQDAKVSPKRSGETPVISPEGSIEQETITPPPTTEKEDTPNQETGNRMQQAWSAAQNMDSEEAYRRFINKYPKSRWAGEAEKKIASNYRYELLFGPVLKEGKRLELHFSTGKLPFQIKIILPNGKSMEKTWNSKDPFRMDLGEIEKKASGLSVLKVVVTDYNFKKVGQALPIY